MKFNQVLKKYRAISFTEKEKGTKFERLMHSWLLADPRYERTLKLLTVSLFLALIPSFVGAEEFELNGICYSIIKKGSIVEVTKKPSGYYYEGDIVIPSSVEYDGATYTVAGIGKVAFYNCSNLLSVIIPNSVTNIGQEAFEHCKAIKTIEIPNSVVTMGGSAFCDCTSLISVTLPNNLEVLEDNLFHGCTNLTTVTIPNSVTSIEKYAFDNCKKLSSIVIPNSVTDMSFGVFSGCSDLSSVTISANLKGISSDTFSHCTSLVSIIIPDNIQNIGDGSFMGCSNLTDIVIGSGIKKINENAFRECKNIATVTCYATNVPQTKSNVFKDSYINYAKLYVPSSSIDAYKKASPWNEFSSISAIGETAIETIETDNMINHHIYTINGQKRKNIGKGLNIIRTKDGKTKKVIIK